MNAIIFGAHGQDGYYLSRLLIEQGVDLISVARVDPTLTDKEDSYNIDISNSEQVFDLIKKTCPTYIFHLAANSTTNHAAIFENHKTICTGSLNILEAVRLHSPKTKVFISGSGLQFINNGNPIKETDEFEARDAYSVSRIHSVYAARYFRSLGIQVYVGYFFNHDSPRRTERHMAKKIAEAVKRIGQGSDEKIEIGDMSVVKEWTYAGDVVEGVWCLVNQTNVFEVSIGSGLGYSIKDWLTICFNHIGKDWQAYVTVNKSFKADYKSLIADPSTLFSLGWTPTVSIKKLASMMLEDQK